MDDIFCLFNDENDASLFLDYLNKQHPNIKFTTESENNGTLPFLDVNIRKGEEVTTRYGGLNIGQVNN